MVRDHDADEPHVLTHLTGGMAVSASQTASGVRPGDRGRTLLQIAFQNQFPSSRTLTSLRLTNDTAGPGDDDQRDAELGEVSVVVDDGDGAYEPGVDSLLLSTVALGGNVTFAPLATSIPPGGTLRLAW